MTDLLPCRFCGAAPHAWLDDYINGRIVPDPYYIVECENADCSVYPEIRGIWPRTDEVRAMWNAANALPAEQPDAVRLRQLLEAIVDEYNDQTFGPIMHSIVAARAELEGTD